MHTALTSVNLLICRFHYLNAIGRSMGPVYKRVCSRNTAPYYYMCHGSEQSSSDCQVIRGDIIDAAIGEFVIKLMNHNNIDLALGVNQLVRDEYARADALRVQQIDRLRHQCDQAQRRFFAVDPDHRLVAASLEAKWEDCLSELNHAIAQREAIAEKHDRETAAEQSTRLHEITRDFSLVWHAPQTQSRERKQLLGFAIEDVTLLREDYTATISLRLRGGQTVTLNPVSLPKPSWMVQQTPPETIEKISQLAPQHLDYQIAEQLNLDGCRTWNDELYTAKKVQAIRKRKAIPGFVEIRRQALRRDAKRILCKSGDLPLRWHKRGRVSGHSLKELQSLYEDLSQMRDFRRAQGRKHAVACSFAILILAQLSNFNGCLAAAQFAAALTQDELKAIGGWYNRKTGLYEPPSKSTLHTRFNDTEHLV